MPAVSLCSLSASCCILELIVVHGAMKSIGSAFFQSQKTVAVSFLGDLFEFSWFMQWMSMPPLHKLFLCFIVDIGHPCFTFCDDVVKEVVSFNVVLQESQNRVHFLVIHKHLGDTLTAKLVIMLAYLWEFHTEHCVQFEENHVKAQLLCKPLLPLLIQASQSQQATNHFVLHCEYSFDHL